MMSCLTYVKNHKNMIPVRIFIRVMRTYQIGAIEAQWLLNQPADARVILSNGKVKEPLQNL